MSGFALHPDALADLEEIREYIARDSSDAADRVMQEMFSCFAALVQTPHSGHLRPDLTSSPLRFLRIYDYLVAYAPEETPLWVIGVIHGRRNPRLIGSLLKERG